MALKEKIKPVVNAVSSPSEDKVEEFINKGGSVAVEKKKQEEDHRLCLRIPRWLMDAIDQKRKERVGKISRTLWILEQINNGI